MNRDSIGHLGVDQHYCAKEAYVTISLATSPYNIAVLLSLGVQVPALLCGVYLDPSSSLLRNPRVLALVLAPWFLGFAILGTTVRHPLKFIFFP